MKHIFQHFICLLVAVLCLGQVCAEQVSFGPSDFSGQGTSGTGSAMSATKSGFTISIGKGFGTTEIRAYSGSSFEISSTNTITALSFTFSGGKTGGLSTSYTGLSTTSWSQNLNSQARFSNITITYSAGGSTEPTLSVDPASIDFGTVEQGASVSSEAIAVTFANLTGDVTYSGLSGAFSATGNIVSTGDEITIAANTSNVGEYEQTLTVTSAADSKSATVTVTMNVVEPFDGLKLDFDLSENNLSLPTAKGSSVSGNYTYTIGTTDYTFFVTDYQGSSDGGIYFSTSYTMIYASNALGLPAISGYKLVKVEASNSSGCSTSVEVSVRKGQTSSYDVVSGGAAQTWSTGGSKYTYNLTGTEENTMYYLYVATKNCQLTGLSLYYEEAEAAIVAQPSISGEDNFFVSTEVSMSCTTEGASIYYTTKESAKATPATSGDWSAYKDASKPLFNATTTVWAAATDGAHWSDVTEKTFNKATIMTVAQALSATPAANQYVKGIIYSIEEVSTEHGNATYYLKDENQNNSIKIYRGKFLNNASFTAENQIYEGDEVTVQGTISAYQSVNQFAQGNYIVALKPAARLSWSETSFNAELEGVNTFPTLTNTNGVTVTYSSSNTSAATISNEAGHEGEITLVAVGSTTIKATFAGNETYKANEVSYTLNVANSVVRANISFEENGGSTVADLTQQTNLPETLPTTTKVGKNFGGWWTTSTFETGTEAVAGATITSTDAITLYAKWLEPYTVAEALAIIDALADDGQTANSVYVAGVVCTAPTSNPSSGKLTFYISADGVENDRIQAYNCKGLNNQNFSAKTDIQKDDEVVIYGPLKKYMKDSEPVPEFNTGYLYSRKADAELAWSAEEFTAYIGESNTFPTLTNAHNVKVTYSSSETSYATINASTGAISLVAEGTTVIKATFAGDETYRAAEVSYTLQVHPAIVHGKITYVLNGGSGVDNVADATALPSPLPTPTKENSVFDGWYTDAQFNTPAVAGASLTGDITLYAKWSEIPVWAYTYTSNVTIASNTAAHVTIGGTDYDAAKTSKGASATITLPQGVTKIHLHLVAWKDEAQTVTVSGDCFNADKNLSIIANDAVSGTGTTYALGASGVDYYFSLTPDKAVAENEVITITAASNKRFVLFGVNQEGGVLPVLDHIAITGTMSNTTDWKTGDEITPEGLTVNAYYTLNEVEQAPVDVTASVVWSHASLVENQTEVTLTATYTENEVVKTANVNVTIDAVETGDPTIITDPASYLNFGSSVVQDAVVASKTITVTLKNITNATATLGGTNYSAFSIDDTEIVDGDVITVSVNTSTPGVYAGTVTIKDNNSETEKVIALSMTVVEPEVPETAVSTNSEWIPATELTDGLVVLITGEDNGTIYAMSEDRGNNRGVVAGNITEGIFTPGANTMSFTLVAQDGGTFALRTSNGKYLYAGGKGDNNYLNTKAYSGDLDVNAKWNIDLSASTIIATSSNRNEMRFNKTNNPKIISCYQSTNTSPTVALYVPKPAPTYTITYAAGGGSGAAPEAFTKKEGETFEVAAANTFTAPEGKEFDKWNDGANDYAPGATYTVGTSDVVLKAIWKDAQPEPQDPEEDWTDGIRTGLTIGNYYTMCLNKAVTNVRGASIWRIVSKTADVTGIILEEVTTLAAGRPYLFSATAKSMDVVYSGAAVNAPVNDDENHGLIGAFVQTQIANVATNYILYNNALYFVNSDNVYVGANRAYLDLNGVPAYNNGDEPQVGNSPRRRVTMSVHGQNVATDVDAISVSEKPMKLMIDGQLFILRGEKMYDATGRLVK